MEINKTKTFEIDNRLGGTPSMPTSLTNGSDITMMPEKSIMSKIKNAALSRYLAATLALGSVAVNTACDPKTPTPISQVDQAKEAADKVKEAADKEFAAIFDVNNPKMAKLLVPSILDGKPVVSIPVSPVPNNKAFTEAFTNFMDIELRLVNAKARTYTITPIINKSSVEAIIAKSQELEPGKAEYGIGLLNHAINSSGVKRDLTPGLFIVDKDDNNAATKDPYIAQLPARFTIEDIAKFNPNTSLKTPTFTLSKTDSYKLLLGAATIGVQLEDLVFQINPSVEAQSIVNSN
jgi:hypothetical protein